MSKNQSQELAQVIRQATSLHQAENFSNLAICRRYLAPCCLIAKSQLNHFKLCLAAKIETPCFLKHQLLCAEGSSVVQKCRILLWGAQQQQELSNRGHRAEIT